MTLRRAAVPLTCLVLAAAPTRGDAQQLSLTLLDTAVLRAPGLDESSGLVASRRRPGVFWTHNDSGNGPQLFATDSSGADLGFVTLRGAVNVDWEDIASGPCPRSNGPCLFIGDIGDNRGDRGSIVVYVVPEPDPPAGPADTLRVATPQDTLVLRYPDHPHDAEALAVHDGLLYLVTKDRFGPAVLFTARVGASGTQTLQRRTELAIRIAPIRGRLVTGADFSADGRLLVLRTYATIHVFAIHGDIIAPLTAPDGLLIPVVETQGEAIAVDSAGRIVLAGERGRVGRAILVRLRLNGAPGM